MVSMDVLQQMMFALQEQNSQNMMKLQQSNLEAVQAIIATVRPQRNLTDSRGSGKPVTFQGEEKKYAEWKAKMLAFLKVNVRNSDDWIAWAVGAKDSITAEDIAKDWGQQAGQVMYFSSTLYATLLSCAEEDAFRIFHSVKDGQ